MTFNETVQEYFNAVNIAIAYGDAIGVYIYSRMLYRAAVAFNLY